MRAGSIAIAVAGALVSMPAVAGTTIASEFTRSGAAEALVTPFTDIAGVTTSNSYTGFVEVLVSGTGFSAATRINDAFHFTDNQTQTGTYYQLGIGVAGNPFPLPPSAALNKIVFIDGVGYVAPGTAPAYAPDNSYRFVIDLGAQNTALTAGVLDGIYGDNGGAYNISFWQLGLGGAVPEPGTWALLLIGFGAAGAAMRRRKAPSMRLSYA